MSPTGTRGKTAPGAGCRVPGAGFGLGTRHPAPGTRSQEPGAQRHAGFTLIELLVVLIGLVMVAAAIVPALRGAGRRDDLDAVATRIAAAARYGRETAIERQRLMGLTVETEPDGVRLEFLAPAPGTRHPAPGGDGERFLPSAFEFVRIPARMSAHLEPAPVEAMSAAHFGTTAPSRVGASGENTQVRFLPDGRTEGGVVVLTDSRGGERRIIVMPETGVVRVEQ